LLPDRRSLINRTHPELAVIRQCELLAVPRSSVYYQPKPIVSDQDILLMHRIDGIYTDLPYYGAVKITKQLKRDGYPINHKRIERLMRKIGIEAIRPKKRTSIPNQQHRKFPYLLRGIKAQYPNHIWGTDITYIRAAGTWFYLVALLDWYSRYVLSWELSDSMTADFCITNLETALTQAQPEIHNSDQGSQFTAEEYLAVLEERPVIRISMDGQGRCWDNIMNERLWRSVKREEVYLKDYQSFAEDNRELSGYFKTYNERRLHASLDYRSPTEVYFAN
jgi:putative transposase